MRIAARGLVAGRNGVAASGAVDLDLGEGGALLVTGPNGAGKSTLLRTLAGLLPPVAGEIAVSGAIAPDGEPAARLWEVAHYFGHRNALKPAASVRANLRFWQRFLGAPDMGIEAALEAVGLGDLGALPAGRLSAGQGRRAAFARLLVSHRPVWILDEPTASLDRASEARMAALLADHRAKGGIVVAATHQPLGLGGAAELRLDGPEPAADLGAAIDEAALARAEGWL